MLYITKTWIFCHKMSPGYALLTKGKWAFGQLNSFQTWLLINTNHYGSQHIAFLSSIDQGHWGAQTQVIHCI